MAKEIPFKHEPDVLPLQHEGVELPFEHKQVERDSRARFGIIKFAARFACFFHPFFNGGPDLLEGELKVSIHVVARAKHFNLSVREI